LAMRSGIRREADTGLKPLYVYVLLSSFQKMMHKLSREFRRTARRTLNG
jgi:hypothetical protein